MGKACLVRTALDDNDEILARFVKGKFQARQIQIAPYAAFTEAVSQLSDEMMDQD